MSWQQDRAIRPSLGEPSLAIGRLEAPGTALIAPSLLLRVGELSVGKAGSLRHVRREKWGRYSASCGRRATGYLGPQPRPRGSKNALTRSCTLKMGAYSCWRKLDRLAIHARLAHDNFQFARSHKASRRAKLLGVGCCSGYGRCRGIPLANSSPSSRCWSLVMRSPSSDSRIVLNATATRPDASLWQMCVAFGAIRSATKRGNGECNTN